MDARTTSRVLAAAVLAATPAIAAAPAAAQPATHVYGSATKTMGWCSETLSLHASNDPVDASASYVTVAATCGAVTTVTGSEIDCFWVAGDRAVVGGRGLRVWVERRSSGEVAFRTARTSSCGLRPATGGDAVGFVDFHRS